MQLREFLDDRSVSNLASERQRDQHGAARDRTRQEASR
jgi:hypothetical protein